MKFILAGSLSSALAHFAANGLALILEEANARGVHWWWDDSIEARAVVSTDGEVSVGDAIREHALARGDRSWLHARAELSDGSRPVFTPRITKPVTDDDWERLVSAREQGLDSVTNWLDLQMIGALGEPSYWSVTKFSRHAAEAEPDKGSSRFEMMSRNSGRTFLENRVIPLRNIIVERNVDEIEAGLTGELVEDELGKNATNSRTPCGFTVPRRTDNAMAWCALWGIAATTLIPQAAHHSETAGTWPRSRVHPESVMLPAFTQPTSPDRWSNVASSVQLDNALKGDDDLAARQWLSAHGVAALIRFPIVVKGSVNAPERLLLDGIVEGVS